MVRPPVLAAVLLALLFLGGCAGGRELARTLATDQGWRPVRFETASYVLLGYLKPGPGGDLAVYLEGDGRAYRSRTAPSQDPTPADPVGLRLALADPAPGVLYLGRACQYVEGPEARGCEPRAWTTARFSPPVLASLDQALDQAKALAGAGRLFLAGYSGGGGLAVLAAASRADVAGVFTVAGNLDHAAWTALHRVTPLSGSLNPADAAPRIRDLPQVHFVGGRDPVVPEAVARSYLERMGGPSAARVEVLPEADHVRPWPDIWPDLLARFRTDWPTRPGGAPETRAVTTRP